MGNLNHVRLYLKQKELRVELQALWHYIFIFLLLLLNYQKTCHLNTVSAIWLGSSLFTLKWSVHFMVKSFHKSKYKCQVGSSICGLLPRVGPKDLPLLRFHVLKKKKYKTKLKIKNKKNVCQVPCSSIGTS